MARSVQLDDLRLLAVTGVDRTSFLQGQLTQDVPSVAGGDGTVLAGWADPQGRLLFAGHLFATTLGGEAALALPVPAATAEALQKRLRMYVLRAKATVALADTPLTGLFLSGEPDTGATGVRLAGDASRRLLLGPPPAAASPATQADWDLADIRAGLPLVLPANSAEFVPQFVNLDLLGGISFTKGCYTGQEIVARIKYRGRVKRRMFRFACASPPPGPGAPLFGAGGAAGRVVLAAPAGAGSEFLAVTVLDEAAGPLFLDEARTVPANRLDLPYAITD